LNFLISHFAIAKIGAVAVPFNIMFKGAEIRYILNNSKSRVLIAEASEAEINVVPLFPEIPSLEKIITVGESNIKDAVSFKSFLDAAQNQLTAVVCAPDDPVSILYTSGTTGVPKGAVLTHNNFLSIAQINGNKVLHVNDQDLFYTGTPYCHIFYVLAVLGPVFAGSGLVVSKRFLPDKALEYISKYRVTHFAGVPTMYIYMLDAYSPEKHDLGAWRFYA